MKRLDLYLRLSLIWLAVLAAACGYMLFNYIG